MTRLQRAQQKSRRAVSVLVAALAVTGLAGCNSGDDGGGVRGAEDTAGAETGDAAAPVDGPVAVPLVSLEESRAYGRATLAADDGATRVTIELPRARGQGLSLVIARGTCHDRGFEPAYELGPVEGDRFESRVDVEVSELLGTPHALLVGEGGVEAPTACGRIVPTGD